MRRATAPQNKSGAPWDAACACQARAGLAQPCHLARVTVPFMRAEWPGKEQKKL